MYDEMRNSDGGWVDFRDFRVVKKEVESDVITSFYLQPADGKAIPSYKPGQYITVKAEVPDVPYNQLRHYSLSCAPRADFYRISVKREDATADYPKGFVSSFLHNNIEEGSVLPISAPAGDFFLDQQDTRPLVLISGGVGLTPMISMLETTIQNQSEREIIYIHAARSGKFHAMKDRVDEIVSKHNNVKKITIYDNPAEGEQYDKQGYIDQEWLSTVLPTSDAAFYFCGPKGFMRAVNKHLKALNVKDTDIHFEIFGPAEDITQ